MAFGCGYNCILPVTTENANSGLHSKTEEQIICINRHIRRKTLWGVQCDAARPEANEWIVYHYKAEYFALMAQTEMIYSSYITAIFQ